MDAISLKLPADLLRASARCAEALGMSRAEYIRRAVEDMNRRQEEASRSRQMAEASHRVRKESMRVNADFAAVERPPDV